MERVHASTQRRRGETEALRVGIIGGSRFGLEEPLAGGLETLVATLAGSLARRGHDVTVFAGRSAAGERDGYRVQPLTRTRFRASATARADVTMPPERFMDDHHAYLRLAVELRSRRFDVLHNHSLHYLPPTFDLPTPMVHTLHSPPTPWLESAFACRARAGDVVTSVSVANAAAWGDLVDLVVPNGVDTTRWAPGRGGGDHAVWTGRLVPEKAPHLAIDAARRAGLDLLLAGPAHDLTYFDREVGPRLGDGVTYLGHLTTTELVGVVGSARCAVVTPVWDEPYGLVVAEALATGTPVAAFDRGAIGEIVDDRTGALAPADDVERLAEAIRVAGTLSRRECRERAERHCSITAMTERYEGVYRAGRAPVGAGW